MSTGGRGQGQGQDQGPKTNSGIMTGRRLYFKVSVKDQIRTNCPRCGEEIVYPKLEDRIRLALVGTIGISQDSGNFHGQSEINPTQIILEQEKTEIIFFCIIEYHEEKIYI